MVFRPCAAGLSGLNEWAVPEFPVWTGLIQAPMQMGLVFGYGFGSGFCSGRFHSTRVITPGALILQGCAVSEQLILVRKIQEIDFPTPYGDTYTFRETFQDIPSRMQPA